MTKSQLILFFCFVTTIIFAQEDNDTIYFPQEQILLKSCSNETNTTECIRNYFQKAVFAKLNEKKLLKTISKLEKDTVSIAARLTFNTDKTLNKEKSMTWVSGKKMKAKLGSDLDAIFFNVDVQEIKNRKAAHVSFHNFKYNYLIQKNDTKTTLILVPNKEPYSGGVIEKAPVFPGCENLNDDESRLCFNQKMQSHIGAHFRYPEMAHKKKIQGRVSIIFNIDKEGNVGNIRTRGPHKILEEEAIRIITLLPKITPGLVNGKPVKVPYSIPINFRLQ